MSGRRSKQTRESGSTDAGAPPIPPKPANRKLLFAGGAVLVGLLFAFIVIEVSLLIAGQPQFLKPHEDVPQFEPLYEDAPFPVYTNTPSNRIVFKYGSNPRGYFGAENEVVHSTNAQGFRGKEFSGEKRPGVTRIAFLGDSVAFGEGVRDSDTCPEQTVAMLNKQSGANGKQYESLNFGVGGYNTQLAHFAFMRFVRPTQPDIVVLIYSLNDAEPPMFIYNAQTGEVERRARETHVPEGQGDPEPPDSLLYSFATTRLVWKALAGRARTDAVTDYYKSLYAPGSPAWAANREALRELIAECGRRNIPCYVACFPVLHRLDDTYPFAAIHDEVGKTVRESGAQFIDLFPVLKGRDARELQVYPTDQHPNETAHAIAAEAIAAALSKN